ncbi:stage III sporulation protein AF [Clostridium sp. D2Q-11]|uniref:Stage III sporulation protein AF n=1 Tax=Anaeromonas frigoriresistens TaxID=2683708 RepID=A0A942Z7X3_9FIRM|nr:stage III sporulation protein AF [Anaeromonas frigoriresistens]MBS4539991.1 stage III sporulation protein AF [Anaeromonas frigoriresistens]
MIEFLRQWIINIVILSIFIALLEAILPNNSFKGYIKMIGGFLMIIVLLNPFIKLLSNNISIDKEVFATMDKYSSMESSEMNISMTNEDQIENLYIDKLKNNIRSSIETNFNYIIDNINIELSDEKESYGEINGLSISISKKQETKVSNDEILVEEIRISKDENKDKQVENDSYKEIQNYIHDEYKIPLENISIMEN